jgi:N-acetylmuramoyl-L-alanine amidase
MPSSLRRGYEDDDRKTYPNNRFDSENVVLAARLHASLVKATGRRDRGVRRARFMTVLREQQRPAVLVEGGFLSNPAEAGVILEPAYREQLARAVCDALPD